MKILVIEGIDRVGKTTLVTRITNIFKGNKHITTAIIKDSFLKVSDMMSKEIQAEKLMTEVNCLLGLSKSDLSDNLVVILDRFHLSEYVYGKCERGYENKDVWTIDKLLNDICDTTLILVNPTSIDRSSKEHGSDLSKHMKEMQDAALRSSIDKKIICNYDTLDDAVISILSDM